MLRDEDGLKGSVPVAWHINRQLAEVAIQRLLAMAVAILPARLVIGALLP